MSDNLDPNDPHSPYPCVIRGHEMLRRHTPTGRSVVRTEYSRDNGATWHRTARAALEHSEQSYGKL